MFHRIRYKVLFFFLIVGIVPLAITIYFNYKEAKEAIEKKTFDQLNSIREIRKENIEQYYKSIESHLKVMSSAILFPKIGLKIREAFEDYVRNDVKYNSEVIQQYYEDSIKSNLNGRKQYDYIDNYISFVLKDPVTMSVQQDFLIDPYQRNTQYQQVVENIDQMQLLNDVISMSFSNFFMIDNRTGYIIYSRYRHINFGLKVSEFPTDYPSLAQSFERCSHLPNGEVFISDFGRYIPYFMSPAGFASTPLYIDGKSEFTIVFELSLNQINTIMTNDENWDRFGFGETGESIIVGEDYRIRNDSRFMIDDSSAFLKDLSDANIDQEIIDDVKRYNTAMLFLKVKTIASERALAGESGTKIILDYRKTSVLASYTFLNIKGLNWALISKMDKDEAFLPIHRLKIEYQFIFIISLILIITFTLILTRYIVNPVNVLMKGIKALKFNKFVRLTSVSNDEFKILTESFNSSVEELSKHRQDLIDKNKILFQQKQEITASINYAVNIQKASMPNINEINKILPESLIFFKPKDVVSGDFYWFYKRENNIIIVAGDCTGHGVPGAFMSLIGTQLLNGIVVKKETTRPSDILNNLREELLSFFHTGSNDRINVNDGIDMSVCNYNFRKKILQYAGANNPLVKIHNEELEVIKADRFPIGTYEIGTNKNFVNHEMKVSKGDVFYLFSDGYQDQFGGTTGKKFKSSRLRQMLYNIHKKPMEEQREVLNETIQTWMGDEDQTDDMVLIGFRIA